MTKILRFKIVQSVLSDAACSDVKGKVIPITGLFGPEGG